VDRNPNQPKRQQDYPNKGIKHQSQQRQRPADDKKNASEKKS
jgi:hypothetical protein